MLFVPVTRQHSTLGIAPPALNGILWGVSSHPGNTQEQHSHLWLTASENPCQPPQLSRDKEIYRRVVQPATTRFLSLKALKHPPQQPKQQRLMSRHGKSLRSSHGYCTLVRWLNTSCLVQMCPSSLQSSISWRQLHPVWTVNWCDWPCTDNAGTWHSSSKRELWRGTEQIKHPVLWEKQRLQKVHKGDSH